MINWHTLRAESKRMIIEAVQDGTAHVNSRDKLMVAILLRRDGLLVQDENRIALAFWLPTADARALVEVNEAKLERVGG